MVAQQFRLGDGKIEGAQHVEAFMGFTQIGMGFLDDNASLGEALGGLACDRHDLGINGRDAEIGRIGDTLGLFALERARQKRGG